jgi:hypothetical protein
LKRKASGARGEAMSHVAERCYDVDGGTLRVSLKADHSLTRREYDALQKVAESYIGCFERTARVAPARDEDDDAVYALGGEENICAG